MDLARMLNGTPRRVARILLLAVLFLLLATVVAPGPLLPPAGPAQGTITATPISLDDANPGRRRLGSLVFRRGWMLDSEDRRFGGISAMRIEGGEIIALSDGGVILQFAVPRAPGQLSMRVLPLPQSAARGRMSQDSEALQIQGDEAWIAFESRNAIARYRVFDWRVQGAARPSAMRRWRRNGGPEAMVRLADGGFLVFAEGRPDGSLFSPVILFDGDPTVAGTREVELRYRRPAGYRITDAALLPDGRLMLLNRRAVWFGGFSAKLVIAEAFRLNAGATIEGREIAELRSPLTVDNMEALSVTREGDRTIVRIASDNNFMAIQRTLLLEFALVEPDPRRPRPRPASSRSRASGAAP
jgi:hypothetical protein